MHDIYEHTVPVGHTLHKETVVHTSPSVAGCGYQFNLSNLTIFFIHTQLAPLRGRRDLHSIN